MFKPKKSLGQNFLTNQKALFDIVSAGNIQKNELILEIGGGKGALTEKILSLKANLIVIEKDTELFTFLKEKFKTYLENKQLILINEDILKIDLESLLKKYFSYYKVKKYKLIANIPYNITGAIFEKFLTLENKPDKLVLLVQKEVALRIVAKNKKESILSLSVKLYGNPKIISKVSAGSFYPKPKVDSAILEIITKTLILNKRKEELYFKVIKSSFAHKRKLMLNNLKKDFSEVDFLNIFKKLKLNPKSRAEDLNKSDFLNIVDNL